MVTFKCIRGGSEVSFTSEYDIKQMRAHEEYVEVIPATPVKQPVVKKPTKEEWYGYLSWLRWKWWCN
mgnify:CR=1 FL=1